MLIDCELEDIKYTATFFAHKLGISNTLCVLKIIESPSDTNDGVIKFISDDLLPSAIITLNPLCNRAAALAHELVHLKQYLLGELKDVEVDNKFHTYWMGEFYTDKLTFDMSTEEYYFLPWEVEAFGKSVGLMALYNEISDDDLYSGNY